MEATLKKIKSHYPCAVRWKKLLASLGKATADDDAVSVKRIIDSNGIDDAIWALRAVDGHNREIRLFAAWCAEQVLHLFEQDYPNDMRPRLAIKAARDYANGLITDNEMNAARYAAGEAVTSAARLSAWSAARAAARAAAEVSAGSAARAVAWEVAMVDARAAQKAELIRVCECIENGQDPYPNI